jgi:hypothetical protein
MPIDKARLITIRKSITTAGNGIINNATIMTRLKAIAASVDFSNERRSNKEKKML